MTSAGPKTTVSRAKWVQIVVTATVTLLVLFHGDLTSHSHPTAPQQQQPAVSDATVTIAEDVATTSPAAGTATTVIGNPFDVTDEAADAFDACKNFVTNDLKTPDGATWRDPFGDQVTYLNDGSPQWVVLASVDAENSFGAKLRTDYACTVTDQGDSWHLDNLNDT